MGGADVIEGWFKGVAGGGAVMGVDTDNVAAEFRRLDGTSMDHQAQDGRQRKDTDEVSDGQSSYTRWPDGGRPIRTWPTGS